MNSGDFKWVIASIAVYNPEKYNNYSLCQSCSQLRHMLYMNAVLLVWLEMASSVGLILNVGRKLCGIHEKVDQSKGNKQQRCVVQTPIMSRATELCQHGNDVVFNKVKTDGMKVIGV